MNRSNRKLWSLNQLPDLSQFLYPKPLNEGEDMPLEKGPCHNTRHVLLIFSPSFPKGTYDIQFRVTVHWGKENNQTFQGY